MQPEKVDNMLTHLDQLGHRIDVVRGIRLKSRSKWAYDYWSLVERQLMRKLSDINRQYTV